MYTEHFGLSEFPFSLTCDPRFFYANRSYQQAFIAVRYGIKLNKGVIVLTGESGTGKTSLLRIVKDKSESNIQAAVVARPDREFSALLRLIMLSLDLPEPPADERARIQELRRYLLKQRKKKRLVAVMLDEAQNLDLPVLHELESLLDLKSANKSLLQIILAGGPELEQKLANPALLSFKQHIALRCRLEPIKADEVGTYIHHRLARAGYQGPGLFRPDTIERIAVYSKGIPRLINVICDNAFLAAWTASEKIITVQTIQKVSANLKLIEKSQVNPAAFPTAHVISQPGEEDCQPGNLDTKGGARSDEEERFRLEEWMIGLQSKAHHGRGGGRLRRFTRSTVVAMLFLAVIGAMLYTGQSVIFGVKSSDVVGVRQQTSEQVGAIEPKEQERFDKIYPTDPATSDGSAAAREVIQVDTTIYVITSAERDRSVLDEIGDSLRTKGYSIRDTRLTTGRTEGDVRFFFPRDRSDAETVKSVVESELARRGYRMSLKLLERDGTQFEFAAPGKIEVWLPPLADSQF
ncbi:MAG: AAA family ATPase [Deltaproteobacteria bacterium]|nr:AAA family ATPase [Deltaproteobacteria bacterium]